MPNLDPPNIDPKDVPVDATTVEARIEERFRLCDAGQPLIQELRRLCRNRLAQEGKPNDD